MLLLFALLAGCTETEDSTFDHCDVQGILEPAVAAVGDTVLISGGPFTEIYDTRVQLDGVDAVVVDLGREGCDECDDCMEDVECDPCSACIECDPWCADCEESVSFEVPDIDEGEVPVVLLNRYGSTDPMSLVVQGAPD